MNSINNTESIDNTPMQINWVKLALQVGIPTVMAVYLVYSLNETVRASLDSANKGILGMQESYRLHSVDTSYQMKQMNSIESILRSICVNAAKNNIERDTCVKVER